MQLLQHFKELTLHPKNAQKLKGLILQLALRGRLTDKLILNRKVTKNNLVKGYFELPKDWYWDKFDNVCEFQMGKTPPSKDLEYWDGDYPWISIADMETYATILETKKTLNDKGLSYFKQGLVKQGTLIMSFKLTIGKTSILGVDACHNEAIISVYPNEKILQKYLFLFLPIISNWGTPVNALMGNTLNKGKIQNMNLPIPPLEEQKEIVHIVEILFKEVEQLEQLTKERIALKEDFVTSALRQLATENTATEWDYLQNHFKSFFTEKTAVKKLREAVLQLAVQGKLTVDWRKNNPDTETATELLKRIQKEKVQLIKDKKIKKESPLPPISDDEIPYELPESWVWCRLGDTLLFSDAGKSPDCEKRPVVNQEWGVLTTTSIQKNKFNQNANKVLPANYQINVNQIVEIGDILITRAGPINRTGIACKVDEMNFNLILSDKTIRLKYLKDLLSPDFIVSTLNSDLIRGLLLSKMIGMASSQVNISQSNIKNIQFPFPPIEEQKAIVEKVNALMLLCDQLEQEIEESKNLNEQLMKSVLRAVFEGEKVYLKKQI